jgi:energy-coupling factor transporter transmembrane protein EcfT
LKKRQDLPYTRFWYRVLWVIGPLFVVNLVIQAFFFLTEGKSEIVQNIKYRYTTVGIVYGINLVILLIVVGIVAGYKFRAYLQQGKK